MDDCLAVVSSAQNSDSIQQDLPWKLNGRLGVSGQTVESSGKATSCRATLRVALPMENIERLEIGALVKHAPNFENGLQHPDCTWKLLKGL